MQETAKRIVLVESDARMAVAIRSAVTGAGHRCDTVTSVDACRKALSETAPDLVLIDGVPDGPDPRQLCQSIRRDRNNACVKIVILNGSGRSIERRRCRALGADGVLAKPFGLDELRAEMRRLLTEAPVPAQVPASAPVAAV